MPKKVKATKTLNPLHFEDLEPHRFEDLVRRLLYGFRDWRELEPTGRGGSDEGFDIRAWERTDEITNADEEGEEGARPSDGNLWQVQGKREQSISPSKMRSIIQDGVDGEHPPYGYILAAATNITKATYDAFREELRKKGVREFQFWGKDHLEDQLALPENDEILFTFFGISLSPRRRSRTTEIKFGLNNKNKILRICFGRDEPIDQGIRPTSFLIRDIADRQYPHDEEYNDFKARPRWNEYEAVEADATGVVFRSREHFAYLDREAKEWDFSSAVDVRLRRHRGRRRGERQEEDPSDETHRRVEYYWRHLPRRRQAKFIVYGVVKFDDMLIIDEKGDPEYAIPHIFVEFSERKGPFAFGIANVTQKDKEPIYNNQLGTEYKRAEKFPKEFPQPKAGKVRKVSTLGLPDSAIARLSQRHGVIEFYALDDDRFMVSEGDIINIPKTVDNDLESDFEVTHIFKTTVGKHTEGEVFHQNQLETYAGRKLDQKTPMTVYEVARVIKRIDDGLVYLDDF